MIALEILQGGTIHPLIWNGGVTYGDGCNIEKNRCQNYEWMREDNVKKE